MLLILLVALSEGKTLDIALVKQKVWSTHALFPSGSARSNKRLHCLIRLQKGRFIVAIEFSVGEGLEFVNILGLTDFSEIHGTGELPFNSGNFFLLVFVLSDLIMISHRLEILTIFWGSSILTGLLPLIRIKSMLFIANT